MPAFIRRIVSVLPCAVLGLLAGGSGLRAEEPPAPEDKPAQKTPTPEDYVRAFKRTAEFLAQPVEFYREAMARKRAADNLRALTLRYRQDQPVFPYQTAPNDWMLQLLPYVEQSNLYRPPTLKMYLCPSDPGSGSRFGAPIETVPPVLASHLALPKDVGQVVGEVEKGKAADKAGLRQHDILLKLNDKDVPRDAAAFAKLLADVKPDRPVNAVVLREGKRVEIKGLSLPEGATAGPVLNYADGSVRMISRQVDWQKYLADGTSNTLMLDEVWGARAAASEGWTVWSKGDPILATTFRSKERYTTRHQEGTLVVTVVGTIKDGKATVGGITVREGGDEKKYDALEKVPAEYRDKVAHLIELSAK